MTSPRLTARHLTDANACSDQVALFKQTFPKGAPLTATSLKKARAAGLDVIWAKNLLDAPADAEYRRVNGLAWAEYQRAAEPVWVEYLRVSGIAWVEYQRADGPALAEYQRVGGPAWTEYLRADGPAWTEYLRGRGLALLAALRATLKRGTET